MHIELNMDKCGGCTTHYIHMPGPKAHAQVRKLVPPPSAAAISGEISLLLCSPAGAGRMTLAGSLCWQVA